ncbi:hypothetical protein HAX54_014629, partial [Datura stramonium]|nr:hypothetical protein [Datura stramonium]
SYESVLNPTESSRREEDLVIFGGLRVIFRWAGGWDDWFGWWRRKGGKGERERLFFSGEDDGFRPGFIGNGERWRSEQRKGGAAGGDGEGERKRGRWAATLV